MSDNQEKKADDASMFLKDFDEEEVEIPALDGQEIVDNKEEEFNKENIISNETNKEEDVSFEIMEKTVLKEENTIEQTENIIQNQEEKNKKQEENKQENFLPEENAALKKYIVYISKEFTSLIDSMSIDERTAYINGAIQTKIDCAKENDSKRKKRQFFTHLILIAVVFCIMSPIAILILNKAILMTFENYKYSQESFEKLYKERFEHDRAYMRSIQYNKKHSIK